MILCNSYTNVFHLFSVLLRAFTLFLPLKTEKAYNQGTLFRIELDSRLRGNDGGHGNDGV